MRPPLEADTLGQERSGRCRSSRDVESTGRQSPPADKPPNRPPIPDARLRRRRTTPSHLERRAASRRRRGVAGAPRRRLGSPKRTDKVAAADRCRSPPAEWPSRAGDGNSRLVRTDGERLAGGSADQVLGAVAARIRSVSALSVRRHAQRRRHDAATADRLVGRRLRARGPHPLWPGDAARLHRDRPAVDRASISGSTSTRPASTPPCCSRLRDACKRFSIDIDRVFLSGHSMGGDAAWDIGLAHPDLWAGVIPIVAAADKYVNAATGRMAKLRADVLRLRREGRQQAGPERRRLGPLPDAHRLRRDDRASIKGAATSTFTTRFRTCSPG